MADKPSVVEALSAAMADVQAVGKGSTNQQQGYSFRGIDAVMNAVGPAFRAHGVICLPTVEDVSYNVVEVGQRRTPMRECTVRVRYTFYGPGGDHIECVAVGEAMDSGDKATPKAMSVAYRVALLQALCIPTDEPDADSQTHERSGWQETRRDPQRLAVLELAIEQAPDEPKLKAAWDMVPAAVDAGEIGEDDAQRLSQIVKRRKAELAPPQPQTVPLPSDGSAPSERAMRRMHATFRELGYSQDAKYPVMSRVTGRDITSATQLTAQDVDAIIVELDKRRDELKAQRKEPANAAG